MVLEQHVVLVSSAANAPEDVALHELVDVGTEAIDDLRGQYFPYPRGKRGTYIVVVPDVQLGNLAVGIRKRLGRVPADVVLQVVVVALLTEGLRERMVLPLLGVADVGPVVERAGDTDAVVVDLIAAANPATVSTTNQYLIFSRTKDVLHDVEGSLLVFAQDIVPQRRATPGRLVGADTEAVA